MARRLTEDEISEALVGMPGWNRDGDEIIRVYELPDFPACIEFVRVVAALAEATDHHPDLDIRYRRLRVALTTHDVGGLSDLDFSLARAIDGAFPGA